MKKYFCNMTSAKTFLALKNILQCFSGLRILGGPGPGHSGLIVKCRDCTSSLKKNFKTFQNVPKAKSPNFQNHETHFHLYFEAHQSTKKISFKVYYKTSLVDYNLCYK